jgi:hypothetical protein
VLAARILRSRASDGPDCTVCTDGSVHEPVHDLLRPLADSDYTTLLLGPTPPEVVARAVSMYAHLSLARPTADAVPRGHSRETRSWLLIKELGCGDGVHDVGPDLFLGCYGSFWHGVVGHPRVKLAAGDPLSARRTCRHSTPLASIGPPHTATAGFPRTQAGGMHHGRSV